MAKIQDHARPVGRVVALLVVLAAAAMLVRIPLVASAQAIKTGPAILPAEQRVGQKIKAIKYLAALGCDRCNSGVDETMLAALGDETEEVRIAAVYAVGRRSQEKCPACGEDCCGEKLIERLTKIAAGCDSEHPHEWFEKSERVREAAREAVAKSGRAEVISFETDGNESTAEAEHVPLGSKSTENEAAETPQTPPLQIDRQPLGAFGSGDDGNADLQAVVDVWNKLRGSESKTHGADDLSDALERVQESAATENDTRNAARNDLPADRYADDSDDVYRVAERLKPLRNEDPDLLRLAQAAIANQRVYDAELRERVKALRKAARNLDAIAADLDDAEFYDEADELFDAARSLRLSARKWGPPPREMPATYRNDTEAALAYNLHTLRAQIQLYRTEHDGRYPKVQGDGNGQPSLPQLTGATNAEGDIGVGGEFSAGPYLITIPDNPLDGRNYIEQASTWPPAAATPNGGWLYHEPTGQIAPNTPGHLAD